MNTLLIRLSAPMQSWGTQSRFTVRDTGLEPSKSGVLGLLCAALGIDREDDDGLQPFASLRMGVRVDREGLLKVDYHTAKDVRMANGKTKGTELSNRYYLANAVFLVGLETADLALLEKIQASLQKPVWALFLGRKAFVPSESIVLTDDSGLPVGIQKGESLEQSLKSYPTLCPPEKEKLRVVLEDANGAIVRTDQPLSFSRERRKFAPRRVTVAFFDVPESTKEVA
ncbi:MAG TPA: type I-E CRISPR-associated protein Cas5/CasD [Anaerolineales bacterium]|nr:type I-E CRISPR-associated protein Cas5/CasD [Anaerolineales bacterium]